LPTEQYQEMGWWKQSKIAVRSVDVQSPHLLQFSGITFSHKIKAMEEAFNNVKVQDFKVYLTENQNEHTAIVSKKSTSHREYCVIIPKSATLGSRFGNCTCGFSKKEGIPCVHMVAVSKFGRIDGLTRIAIMPHWYTTIQWRNQFPKNSYINTHQTLKSIKAN
jgi:hypothetical protein